MKNRKWLRIGALVMAVVCLASVASAATYTLDLSGDGKVDVWDIQLAVNGSKGDAHELAILEDILGNPDELRPNADGVYEIYTALGLYNMAKHAEEGADFKLMNDIDLGGIDWTPIDNFYGNFDGNLKTISNFKITKCGVDKSMGFFSVINYNKVSDTECTQSVVKNLNLKDVEITATEEAQFIGLLAGSNRGKVENCTTIGVVNDSRTVLPSHVYVGTLVGRNNNSNPDGTVASGTNLLTATAGTANAEDQVTGLTSKMAMNFAELSYPEGTETAKQYKRNIGIAGYSEAANKDTSMTWQDITNSTELADPVLQARRQKVVDYMYEMCTVEWTPSQQMVMTYYKATTDPYSSTYKVGTTYRGIPYNHGSSGIERFTAQMDTVDGVYTTKSTLPTTAYYVTDSNVVKALSSGTAGQSVTATTSTGKTATLVVPEGWDNTKTSGVFVTGFAMYIGNDCSSAAAWAWRQVSAVSGTGFANPQSTSNMMPTADYTNNAGTKKNGYITSYGIQPVNGLVFEYPYKDMDGDGKTDANMDLSGDGTVDHSDYADQVEAVFAADNQAFWGALAGTSKGDALVGFNDDGGHTRVAAGDAIVIRDHAGKILPKVSYIVTHEQGRGSSGDGWTSSCTVNFKYTFDQLTNYSDYTGGSSGIGSRCCYFPITNKALREVDTPAATATCKLSNGKVTSNFHIVSTTVGSETVYTNTTLSGSRSRCVSVTLASAHPNIATGDTVQVLLSNGQTYTFTY